MNSASWNRATESMQLARLPSYQWKDGRSVVVSFPVGIEFPDKSTLNKEGFSSQI